MTNKKGKSNCKCKYRDLSAAQWTVRLSIASVEMTFFGGRKSGKGNGKNDGNDKSNSWLGDRLHSHSSR